MADLGGDREGDKSDWSISKLMLFLKTAFVAADFAQVEAILHAREQKLKQEIERLKQVEASVLYKLEEESLDKTNVQTQLKNCQAELKEMENKNSELQRENSVLLTRAKGAEERCEKLVAEVKGLGQKVKESVEKENEMFNLRLRNHELECEKARLEDELATATKRFEGLDKRVLSLESHLPLLMNKDDPKSVNRTQNGDSATMGVKCDVVVKVEDVSFGRSCDSPVKTNGNGQNTGSVRLRSQKIIEIGDSDDESALVDIPSEKGITLLHTADNGCSDWIGAEEGVPTLKRKRTSSFGGESENGDTLSEKIKMKKFEEPVCKPDNGPLNGCSTTIISSDGDEVMKGFTTLKKDFTVSRQRERQTESELKSPNLLKGFPGLAFLEENSSSSGSDSDDDNDGMHIIFNHSQLAPEARKENRN